MEFHFNTHTRAQKHLRLWNNLLGVYSATFFGWCCLMFRMKANHICSLFTFLYHITREFLSLSTMLQNSGIFCVFSLFTNQRDLRAKSRNCIIFGVHEIKFRKSLSAFLHPQWYNNKRWHSSRVPFFSSPSGVCICCVALSRIIFVTMSMLFHLFHNSVHSYNARVIGLIGRLNKQI